MIPGENGFEQGQYPEDVPAPMSTNPSSATDSSNTSSADMSRGPSVSAGERLEPKAQKRIRRSPAGWQRPKVHHCRQHCGQKFTTIGKRNKYERKDCPKLGDKRARVRCQYCRKEMTRLHYAENGHLERCRGPVALVQSSLFTN